LSRRRFHRWGGRLHAATVVLVLLNRLLVRVAVALYEQHPLSVGYVVTDAQVELVETAMLVAAWRRFPHRWG
jgi:hypothetical protein